MNITLIVLVSIAGFVVFFLPLGFRLERVWRFLGARRITDDKEEFGILEKIRRVAKEERLPEPALWIRQDFSPNILILRRGSRLELGFSHGLISLLSEVELDLIIRLSMVHGWSSDRSFRTFWAALISPVIGRFTRLPLALKILLFPVLFLLVRFPVNRRAVFRCDKKMATKSHSRRQIAALLQKIAVMQDKIPPRHWNLALDPLFLVPPWGSETHFFGRFLNWPSVLERRTRLLENKAQ